jgi:hypothetical protein
MATIAPPAAPVRTVKTGQVRRKYYTIHSDPNHAFTLKLDAEARTAIVGFVDVDDAMKIGNMIETHFNEMIEWPDTRSGGNLVLPMGRGDPLAQVFIQKWEFEDLKLTCTKNFLDLVSVDELVPGKLTYSLSGAIYKFDAPLDFYRQRMYELYHT